VLNTGGSSQRPPRSHMRTMCAGRSVTTSPSQPHPAPSIGPGSEALLFEIAVSAYGRLLGVRPGATALHRIPRVPYCEATDFVKRTMPALEAP
jgi:hypothetical protein